MPFGPYTDFRDCVSKNQNKDDPAAYCGSIKQKTESRHPDYQRILDEFTSYYKDIRKGDGEYYSWLQALELDETRKYGAARESFRWAENILQFVSEDTSNKYYKVLVGFPIQSMNRNIYKERDLIAAALTLKGSHPTMNHNNEWHFTPDSRWGEVTTVDAKCEDGAIEAILKVSKLAVCPRNNNRYLTELIDNRQIVNVSLQGGCARQDYSGSCDGFTFDDKGFTLLTKDVLPGIPLARIFPLEHIMVEALQASTKKKVKMKIKEDYKMKPRKIVKLKVKEESDPAKMGQTRPPATGRDASHADSSVYKQPGQGTTDGPSGQTFRGDLQGVSQQTNVAVGNDPAAKKPEGVWTVKLAEPENTYPHEGVTGTPLTVKPSDQPAIITPATAMPEVDSHGGPSRTATPPTHLGMPTGDTTMHPTAPGTMSPKPPHDCPDGHHWTDDQGCQPDASALATGGVPNPLEQAENPPVGPCPEGEHRDSEGNCIPNTEELCPEGQHRDGEGNCVDNSDAEETVRRIKAEYKAEGLEKNLKYVESIWIDKFTKLTEQHRKLSNVNMQQSTIINELRLGKRQVENRLDSTQDKYGKELQSVKIELEDFKGRYGGAIRESTKFNQLVETLRIENQDLKSKYHGALKMNLDISRKNTSATEDYLQLAKITEDLKTKLTRTRTQAKKILKVKV